MSEHDYYESEYEWTVLTPAGEFITEPLTDYEFSRRLGRDGARYLASRSGGEGEEFIIFANQVVGFKTHTDET